MIEGIPFRDDLLERYLCSHDISTPPLLKRFFKIADVVFQPEKEEDVLRILKLAEEKRIPVVPRGAATSGYGGVIPVKGGFVLDFTRMDRFEVDEDQKILVSEPGAVWWDIEKELNRKGLSLRVYPTSALSSTVGGWIAQNGYGVGSLAFGSIAENVLRLRVADFRGVREAQNIHLYAGLEGTTGIITKAWIKLREFEEMKAYAFHVSPEKAVSLAYSSGHHSALFLDRNYIKMKNEVFDDRIPERDTLVIVTGDKMDGDETLGQEIWESRFYPMKIKRLGPGIVPAEVIIPCENLPEYLHRISKYSAGSEVWFISKNICSVLSFLPWDERKISYAFKLKFSFKALKIAKKLGGKSYSSGLYLSRESENILENYQELLRFKKEIDPDNLLNPMKVFPSGMISKIIRIAEVFS